MKKFIILFLAIGLLACSSDDPTVSENELRYDGANANSPIFPAGNHEAAARFPSFITNDLVGKGIRSIEIFVYNVPQTFSFNVYSGGSAAGPGALIFSEELSSQMVANSLNSIAFDNPIPINGEIWLSASWNQKDTEQVIGCDAGPANPNGDWLYLSSDGDEWTSFRDRSEESVNWNIRGILTDL